MSRIYSEEKRRERAEYAKEWRRRNPDKVAANRKKERDKFESDPIAKFARNADARERFAEKMKCPEYRKFHAARTAKAKQKDRVAYVSSYIMNAAKQRAEQLGLPFDLHEHADDMKKRISALKCELTGLPLKVNGGRRQFNSVSIDRIDPSAGYVYENVRVIAWSLNAAFGNWGEDAFSAVAEAWLAGRKKKVEEDA